MQEHYKTENIPDSITDLWRLEFQIRDGKIDMQQAEVMRTMKQIHVLAIDNKDDISTEIDNVVIERVNFDRFNLQNVDKKYAAKIRKMVHENVGFDTIVAELSLKIFNEQKDELQKQLDCMFAKYNMGAQKAGPTA